MKEQEIAPFVVLVIDAHFKELEARIHGLRMLYAYAYNDGPDVRMLKHAEDRTRACIVIGTGDEAVAWLIAGDAITGERVRDNRVSKLHEASIEDIFVEVRAQAMCGNVLVKADLGCHKVVAKEIVSEERGILTLE